MKRLNVDMTNDLFTEFKIKSIKEGASMTDIVTKLISEYVSENKLDKKPILSDEAREQRRAYQREQMKKYREKNKEKLNEYQREWRKNNPDKVIQYQENYWTNRAKR